MVWTVTKTYRVGVNLTGAGAGSLTYRGGYEQDGSATLSTSINIGTASSDRLVVVGLIGGTNYLDTGATANGVTLTRACRYGGDTFDYLNALYYGLVTAGSGSQTVVGSFAGVPDAAALHVWTVTGLLSNTPKQTAAAHLGTDGMTISVDAGDFLFAIGRKGGAAWTFGTSTEVPAAVHGDPIYGGLSGADWSIAATNASFLINDAASNNNAAAAASFA